MGLMKKLSMLFGLVARSKWGPSIASKYIKDRKPEIPYKDIFVKSKHLLGKRSAKYNRRMVRKDKAMRDRIVQNHWADEQYWYAARDKAKREMVSKECREMTQTEIRALRVSFAS